MSSKLREQILNAKDIKSEKVFIEQWEIEVEIRGLTGAERAVMLNDMRGSVDFVKLYPQIVIATTYEPGTNIRIFEATDVDLLNSKSGAALEKIATVAMQLSGLKDGAVADAEKNSGKTQNTVSISN